MDYLILKTGGVSVIQGCNGVCRPTNCDGFCTADCSNACAAKCYDLCGAVCTKACGAKCRGFGLA